MKSKKILAAALAAALVLSMQTSAFASTVSNSDIVSSSDVVAIPKTSNDSSVIEAYSEEDESEEFATSGKCGDNLTWSLDTKTGVLTINGDGDMWDSWEFTDEWNSSLIKSVEFKGNITSIGASVFSFCENLENITIPNSVTSIDDYAFHYCDNLKSVTIGKSVTSIGDGVFESCYNLSSINVVDGNKNYASENGILFNNNFSELICCPAKKSGEYIVSNNVTSIASYAFSACENLSKIKILNRNCEFGETVFFGSTIIMGYKGSTAEEYANENYYAFVDIENPYKKGKCGDNLTYTLDADTGMLTISGNGDMWNYGYYEETEDETFSPWTDYVQLIENVVFDGNVTSIGENSFYECSNLENITIPNSVTSIGGGAFACCNNLKGITIPNSAKSIGICTFYDCVSLTSVYLPDSITYIGNGAFERCEKLTSINIPSKVTYIGEYAFSGCVSLKDITLPNTITAINDNTFGSYPWGEGLEYGCSSLTSITIPDSVTSIGVLAFSGCTNLQKIIIPKAVTSIGEASFYGCENLTDLYYTGTEEEWKKISTKYLENMDENHDFRYYLSRVKIHYNYSSPDAIKITGDANGDGKINTVDRMMLSRYIAGWSGYEEIADIDSLDINKDGKVNTLDRMILSRYIANWPGYDKYFS
ncbi:MAG: leucine-rich repeat protein [Acutalibacteraceae bacterium]